MADKEDNFNEQINDFEVSSEQEKSEQENENLNEQENLTEKTSVFGEKIAKIKSFFAKNGKKIARSSLCFFVAIIVFFSGWMVGYFSQNDRTRSLSFFLTYYDKYYFETRDDADGNVTKVLANAILDKYSEYYTAEEYEAVTKANYGEKKGLGLTFLKEDFSVYSVSGNSPAERAGIEAGGVVVAYKTSSDTDFCEVTSENATSSLSEFIEKLASEEETISLKIKYSSDGSDVELYTLEKSEYVENYVYYADDSGYFGFQGDSELKLVGLNHREKMPEFGANAAYIKLTQFNGLNSGSLGAAGQFKLALDKFKEAKKHELILDLRSNGGGFMSILCEIAPYLCYYTEATALCQKAVDKNGDEQLFKMGESKYKDYEIEKIVVLADQNSASASEALIGVMLDYDKASGNNAVSVILSPSKDEDGNVLYKTYGKGIMQSTYVNSFTKEAVKLTTAKIHWPKSEICIHGVGVTDELCEKGYKIISGTQGDIFAAVDYLNQK